MISMVAQEVMPVVLVVDDDEDQRWLMQRALERAGNEVRTASSAREALDRLQDVDLVLLDYRLPDMDGTEVLQALSHRAGPSVVMVTAMGSEQVAVEAMRAGAVDYVVKEEGYLNRLPGVVERAWRHHDIVRRARAVQRLALFVHSATDRDAMCREIVQGARQLLRAESAGLFVMVPDGSIEMLAGDLSGSAAVGARVASLLRSANRPRHPSVGDRSLLVPLPTGDGLLVGALAVWGREYRVPAPEEVELAETFAAFAATALANERRLQLERRLVGELQQTLDMRRQFVMSLSHELRTPLTCVLGFADTLLENWNELDDETRLKCVTSVRDNGRELRSLVEQLLDFGAMEAGKLVAEPAELRLEDEVERTLEALAPLLTDRSVAVEVDHVEVMADAVFLRRVLANLLANAVKHAGAGVPVTVRAVSDERAVRVEVSDAGIGLTSDEIAHVFEPFWRASSARVAATRGSGVGLAVVEAYVRLMGGEVGVESAPGEGSRFWFTVPRPGVPVRTA